MAITLSLRLEDTDLDRRLKELAKRQLIPVSKSAMITAILKAAVADDRGAPTDKWKANVAQFMERANAQSTLSTPSILPPAGTVPDVGSPDGPSTPSPTSVAAGQEDSSAPVLNQKHKRSA